MKIIKPGNVRPKAYRHECFKCGCVFELTEKDCRFIPDQRDGDYYIVDCPEPQCNNPVTISANKFK